MLRRIPIVSDRTSLYDIASPRATPPGDLFTTGGRSTVIGLDPATTSPNVIVGLAATPTERPRFIRPGEWLTFDTPIEQVYVFFPIIRQMAASPNPALPNGIGTGVAGLMGMASLLCGTTIADATMYRSNRTRPLPVAQVIGALTLTATDPSALDGADSLLVYSAGLEKIRLRLIPINALGAPMNPPAGFAGTVSIWSRVRLSGNAAGALDVTQGYLRPIVETNQWQTPSGMTVVHAWNKDDAQDQVISPTKTIIEYDVGAADALTFQLTGLAGAGVVSVFGVAEGQ